MISKIQKAIIRHVTGSKNFIAHTNDLFIQLKTPKFHELILYNHARLCYKVVHLSQPKAIADIFKPTSSTRRQHDLIIPHQQCLSLNDIKFPPISAPKAWNNLPTIVKEAQSLRSMKAKLLDHIMQKYIQLPSCWKYQCPSCLKSRPRFN